jgi:hypothetical protein
LIKWLAGIRREPLNPPTRTRLIELGERIKRAKQGAPLLRGEDGDSSPLNRTSPHNEETGKVTTESPPEHHPITTSSPRNAASYAAPNAPS